VRNKKRVRGRQKQQIVVSAGLTTKIKAPVKSFSGDGQKKAECQN
jgi:hypothetical protein